MTEETYPVGGTGLEQDQKTLEKQGVYESRTAKCAALSANSAKLLAMCGDDAELAELIAVWPGLPDDLRAVILRLARAA